MPVVTRTPVALEIDCRDFTNRVKTSFMLTRSEVVRTPEASAS
jgi:hypothetical protein